MWTLTNYLDIHRACLYKITFRMENLFYCVLQTEIWTRTRTQCEAPLFTCTHGLKGQIHCNLSFRSFHSLSTVDVALIRDNAIFNVLKMEAIPMFQNRKTLCTSIPREKCLREGWGYQTRPSSGNPSLRLTSKQFKRALKSLPKIAVTHLMSYLSRPVPALDLSIFFYLIVCFFVYQLLLVWCFFLSFIWLYFYASG